MNYTPNIDLKTGLEQRLERINIAKTYLAKTRELFDAHGSEELKSSYARFEELENALDADRVRLVVIGEFSRGKSTLVNALLGINLLRSAQEATTAINTFIEALPQGKTERFIRICYQNDQPDQDLAWPDADDSILERWGTELDETHADVRKQVEHIRIFMQHPLLEKGLVLIDTPGLQSVVKHHELITHKAIAEAHVALWVQSTSQLGGNATEWKFLSETIRRNFRKFITVVNMWDQVLEPTDHQERLKPVVQREQEKLNVVKKNFREYLSERSANSLDTLTDADHLMGVSAIWALSDDADKQRSSGIERLAKRISAMLASGEALEEIYRKPLQQLSHIQIQLEEHIHDALLQFRADKTVEQRQRELDLLNQEIENLELEAKTVAQESELEHDRAARHYQELIKNTLMAPLVELKRDIETRVDNYYVQRMINKGVKNIGLPDDLHAQFHAVTEEVVQQWEQQKTELIKALAGLRTDYADKMEKHARQTSLQMQQMNIDLAPLDVSFELDLSEIEQYHQQAMQLEQKMAAHESELESLKTEKVRYAANEPAIKMAQEALLRAERQYEIHGQQQPTPIMRMERECVKEGGIYSNAQYAMVERPYYDNVEIWQKELAHQRENLKDKEARIEAIMEEEQRKMGQRISLEAAERRYASELKKIEREQAKLAQEKQKQCDELAARLLCQLTQSTAGQLDKRIRYLQQHVSKAIDDLFSDQLRILNQCVQEHYIEPLNAKRTKREEIQHLMQHKQTEIEQHRQILEKALEELKDLQFMTQNALQA